MNRETLDSLIETELTKWRRTALRIVGGTADADDAIQSALIKFWVRAENADIEKPKAYITVCVVHESYQIVRKRRMESIKLTAFAADIDRTVEHGDFEAVRHAIAGLPELDRDTIQLAVLDGRSGREAAELFGCTENALYQRIYQAKRRLKTRLEKNYE